MRIVITLLLLSAAPPLLAQDSIDSAQGGEKINQLIVYGDDKCPQSSAEEIIVCARKPETERYRIPENLRGDPNAPDRQSWANRAEALEYVGRTGFNSCSPAGANGFTGCFNEIVREARADRQGRDEVNWNRLIDEARQERLGRIDEEAAQVQADVEANEAERIRREQAADEAAEAAQAPK